MISGFPHYHWQSQEKYTCEIKHGIFLYFKSEFNVMNMDIMDVRRNKAELVRI